MSDVKRFKCIIHGMYAEDVVRASDYDALAQRCRELEAASIMPGFLANPIIDTLRARVERFKNGLGIAQRHRDELQA